MKKIILLTMLLLPVVTSNVFAFSIKNYEIQKQEAISGYVQGKEDDLYSSFKPSITTKTEFIKKVIRLGGKVIWNTELFDLKTGCVDINSSQVNTRFTLKDSSLKEIHGWFYKDKLTSVSFDVNGEFKMFTDSKTDSQRIESNKREFKACTVFITEQQADDMRIKE